MLSPAATFPARDELSQAAPLAAWRQARAQAKRSPLRNFTVGAVLFDPQSGRVLSRGCAHTTDGQRRMASTHAEQHALARALHVDLQGAHCLTFSLNPNGYPARSARPCPACVWSLEQAGIEAVIFCEREGEHWSVRQVPIAELEALRGASGYCRTLRVA